MPRRRELNGITRDFSELLRSRNNDYLGYWATGQLYSLACDHDVNSISLDLVNLSNSVCPTEIDSMCQTMRGLLFKIINGYKMPVNWLKSITVKFSFDQPYQAKYHSWRPYVGNHYIIEVSIESDLGYVHKSTQGGCVLPHDSQREIRRKGY